jgi:Uma2 family endonuclease
MSVETRTVSADQLLRLPHRHRRYELIRGELREMSPAGFEHGTIIGRLTRRLADFVEDGALGVVLGAETGFVLARNPDTVRAPDISFVAQERLQQIGIPAAFFPGAPDLAVEVVSPGDTVEDVESKVDDWLNAGTRLVWVVNPRRRTVTAYRSKQQVNVVAEPDTLDGGEVVPGFRCRVADLFVRP